MLKIEWIDSPFEERDVRAIGIPFGVRTIRLSQIDMKESEYNSARLDKPIVRYLVDDYKRAMQAGNPFFRPFVYTAKSGFILTSGVQRCTAMSELVAEGVLPKTCELEVYVLDTQDQMLIEAVTRSANVNHGGRSTFEERLAHAIHMVRKFGFRTSDAAKLFNVSDSTITQHIRCEQEVGLLACMAMALWSALFLD